MCRGTQFCESLNSLLQIRELFSGHVISGIFSFQTCTEKLLPRTPVWQGARRPGSVPVHSSAFVYAQHRNCAAYVSFPISAVVSAFGCRRIRLPDELMFRRWCSSCWRCIAVVCRGGGFPLRGRAAMLLLSVCCGIYAVMILLLASSLRFQSLCKQ